MTPSLSIFYLTKKKKIKCLKIHFLFRIWITGEEGEVERKGEEERGGGLENKKKGVHKDVI